MMKLTRRGSKLLRPSSWRTMYLERPVFPVASASAKPPPRRRMTPQGSLFSTVFQSSRAGEDFSRLNCLGGAVDPGLGGRISLGETIEHTQVRPAVHELW